MVSSNCNLVYLNSICEDLHWLFGVEIQRIAYAHLPILVVAQAKKPIVLGEEKIVELSRVGRLHRGIKIKLQGFGRLVLVKNLFVLRILVELSTQLEPVVFPDSVNLATLCEVERMLESK